MIGRGLVIVTLATCALLSACAGARYAHENAASLPKDQVVTVVASGALDIVRVDYDAVAIKGEKSVHADTEILLPPGHHTFEVAFRAGGGGHSVGTMTLSRDFEAGKTYRIDFETGGGKVRVFIKEGR